MHTVTTKLYVVVSQDPGLERSVRVDYVSTDRNAAQEAADAINGDERIIRIADVHEHRVGIDSDFAGFEIETR